MSNNELPVVGGFSGGDSTVICHKCHSTNIRKEQREIISFVDGKPYARVSPSSAQKHSVKVLLLCKNCGAIIVHPDYPIDVVKLNRHERRAYGKKSK